MNITSVEHECNKLLHDSPFEYVYKIKPAIKVYPHKISSAAEMVVAKKWIYARAFTGLPTRENFRLEEETLPDIKDNEFLAEAIFASVDPYIRVYMARYPIGSVMVGGQVAKVLQSRHPSFPVGSYIHGNFGWRTHTVCQPDHSEPDWEPYVLPDFGNEPLSLGLGVLGMPGITAYFGFLEICKPVAGETVVVSGAAGAVGSLVGQIAKIKGCEVVGIAGSDEKCEWLKGLGCDHVINYKTSDIEVELRKAAPRGVDCYFDNVGGHITEIVREQMNVFGRISVCGSISSYNGEKAKVADPQPDFLWKQLSQVGFINWRWNNRRLEAIQQNLKWIQEGRLIYRETVTEGFDNLPAAFIGMLSGANTGKAVVKI
ncbi:prostaglandin reductase 1-like [Topomyia yanbarensis]|uniref:prostaglandin reductase 1-like n=1 Tax=Topomyia yanbarensis TaxID=2498891 RepID=UPI00273ACAB2|nr:prostaglandin reductase 1-like [Topomyia yanbarensis]